MSELTAYHESGHVLIATLLGAKVKLVTIEPDNDDAPERHGDTRVLWRRSRMTDQEFARKAVQVSLAGPVAEMIYSGEPYHPGHVVEWAADWRAAWTAAALLFPDKSRLFPDERQRLDYLERISIELYRRMHKDDFWNPLASFADHLLAHETLDAEQITEILAEII